MLILLFIVALVLVGLVVAQSMRQGRRFIRAATFLAEVEAGRPAEQANAAAALLFTGQSSPSADAWAARAADERRQLMGGSQGAVIRAARERGFTA